MSNTILVALSAVALLVVGVVVGIFGKSVVEGIKSGMAKRKANREIAEDRDTVVSDGIWFSTDRKVQIKWNKGLVWVGLASGVKYDSFFDFFNNEEMEMSTYEEVVNAQRRFEQASKQVEAEMYRPKYRTVYNTEKELGEKLYVYRKGELRISDNVMVYIDDVEGNRVVTQVAYALEGLSNKLSPLHTLDFIVTEKNPKEQVDIYMDMWARYLNDHPEEAEIADELEGHLDFYNEMMDDGQIEIINNRVVIKAKQPKEGFFETNVVKSARTTVDRAIKRAQRYEKVNS